MCKRSVESKSRENGLFFPTKRVIIVEIPGKTDLTLIFLCFFIHILLLTTMEPYLISEKLQAPRSETKPIESTTEPQPAGEKKLSKNQLKKLAKQKDKPKVSKEEKMKAVCAPFRRSDHLVGSQ